ncbi:MAG: SDR family NAD(P)-dependent oxidoreductase [Caulobacteraceae bacterium]
MPTSSSTKTVLIVGASRGLGYAMAQEYLERGWNVVGTVRGQARTPLHDLADRSGGQVEIEHIDINVPGEIAALRARLGGRTFDVLFMNSGVGGGDPGEAAGAASTEAFMKLMTTNALSPMRVIEALQDLVPPTSCASGGAPGPG